MKEISTSIRSIIPLFVSHTVGKIGGAETLGPILMGMTRPVHLLPRGAEMEEIINVVAIAVVDAQETEQVA